MTRFRYSDEMIAFLRTGYQTMGIPALTAAFNHRFNLKKSPGAIKSTIKNHRITCGRKTGLNKGQYLSMTPAQVAWLKIQYQALDRQELTTLFNRAFSTEKTVRQIVCFLKNHNIKSGRDGRFKPGCKGWNAGTKGQGLTGPNATSFKKGNISPNRNPLGDERICSKDGFILIKVSETNPYTGAPTRYKHKHVWLWEAANGPAPDGHVITFIDGDKLNCVLENLECISRAEHARRNQMQINQQPPQVRQPLKIIAKIITRAHARQEQKQ